MYTVRPPLRMRDSPRAMLMEPRVTRNGWIDQRTEMKPFRKPKATPMSTEISMELTMLTCRFSSRAQTTADRETREPTERSIPPESITMVMPKATTLTVAVWLAMLMKLPKVKNDLDRIEKMTTMKTNTRIIPRREMLALNLSRLPADGAAFSFTGGILE